MTDNDDFCSAEKFSYGTILSNTIDYSHEISILETIRALCVLWSERV